MKNIALLPTFACIRYSRILLASLTPLLLFMLICSQVNAQGVGKSFLPLQGVSKAIPDPDGSGVVTVVPISPTVIPLGLNRYGGPTANNAGTKQMSANRIVLPPGARGPRNIHKGADSILMIMQGNLTSLIGAAGEKTFILKPGDFLYVPGDVWHQWVNPSQTETVTFIEIRADADDNANVKIIPTP